MRGIEPHRPAGKWVIIHGHFYQPPRENPWLDHIELQPSAAPYHDWNERIYAECYRPNGYSRLLDPEGMITGIHNNYTDMSFNFGPTLMSWLRNKHPVTTNRIIEGDRSSAAKREGHGNAVAQVYNHIIMPLASRRDQITQIRWAKASFKSAFNRDPEGIWLAETAINMETVQCLIDEGITFVILAPQQAEGFRPLDGPAEWTSTAAHPIDTRRPYRLFALNAAGKKTGGHLDVFFFDAGLSKEISFNHLLQDAAILGNRINECYSPAPQQSDEVVVIATDGETFGHHKPFGDMCLAYFFTHIAPALDIRPINFGAYLARHRPLHEAALKNPFGEGTAWSCAHGVGRWTRDCGCSTGGNEGWHQKWRAPLRQALDNLQEPIDEAFVSACTAAGIDPWELRNRYCTMFKGFTKKKWDRFLARQKPRHAVTAEQSKQLRRLLEAQKYLLFSYTSCGWFFSEISGIEPMQNLAYACRALQLGIEPERQPAVLEALMHDLAAAPSNIGGNTGATLFEQRILPFFFHERMLGFAAAMQTALAVTRKNIYKEYGFAYHIENITPENENTAAVPTERRSRWFHVHLEHPASGEESTWLVITDVSNLLEPIGWVLPWNGMPHREMAEPDRLNRNPDTQLFTLADIFTTLRGRLAAVYLEKIAKHSAEQFASWLQKNEQDLTLLQSFHPVLPNHFKAPLLFRLQIEWDACFGLLKDQGNEDTCIGELAEIRKRADHFNGTIGYDQSALLIEQLLTGELNELSFNLTIDRCDRIRYLLNIVDRFSLPVSKHRLEDMFFPVLSGPVAGLHREVVSADENNRMILEGDNRELLIKLLNFARRMNFNTDRYLLS